MSETQLGKMQFRIMQVLWNVGRANAREITDALGTVEPVAPAPYRRSCGSSRPRGRSGTSPTVAPSSFFRG
jgi:BlaI family transcriptional regulator, penicillinase repressor